MAKVHILNNFSGMDVNIIHALNDVQENIADMLWFFSKLDNHGGTNESINSYIYTGLLSDQMPGYTWFQNNKNISHEEWLRIRNGREYESYLQRELRLIAEQYLNAYEIADFNYEIARLHRLESTQFVENHNYSKGIINWANSNCIPNASILINEKHKASIAYAYMR